MGLLSFVVVILFEMKMKKILLSFPFFILCVMLGFTSGVAADGEHSNCDDNGQSCDHSMPWWGWMLMLTVLVLTIVLVSSWCATVARQAILMQRAEEVKEGIEAAGDHAERAGLLSALNLFVRKT